MILQFMSNTWVLMAICTVLIFAEMFGAKRWFTCFSCKISHPTVRRGLNMVLGFATCTVLSIIQYYALCDFFHCAFQWVPVFAAAGIATMIYLVVEKIFGESIVNELGKSLYEFISRSNQFDGKLSAEGAREIAGKLFEIGSDLDEKVASKESKAIDDVVKRLDSFLSDGVLTDDEKSEAEKLIANAGEDITTTSTYAKYRSLLGK